MNNFSKFHPVCWLLQKLSKLNWFHEKVINIFYFKVCENILKNKE